MQTPDSPTRSARSAVFLSFDGKAGTIGLILLRNLALSLITAGMYVFWGHVRVREYLWQHLRVGDDRLVYTGTGRELLTGSLWGLAVGAALGLMVRITHGAPSAWVAVAVALMVGRPVFAFSGRRHLLTHTLLRDVPFNVRPKLGQYVALSAVGAVLSVLTLGVLWPLALNDRYDFLVSHSTWGNKSLRYTGRSGDFLRLCWRGGLLCLVTLGLYAPWLAAQVRRYRGHHTYIDEAHLLITVTGGELLRLWLVNALIVALTMGLGTPWALARSLALRARTTQVKGYIDLGTVSRTAAEASLVLDALDGTKTAEL